MQKIVLKKKSGFKVLTNNPIIIRDFRMKIFYSTEGLKNVKKFNLPRGSYFIDKGNFKKMKKSVQYKLINLPSPQRKLISPHNFSIIFEENPNKCTINWDLKKITFDNDLKSYLLPELYFILYHEFGHQLYKSEKFADLFASNVMLKKGYNPSQIGLAPLYSLSSAQFDRKGNVILKIIKNNGRKKRIKL